MGFPSRPTAPRSDRKAALLAGEGHIAQAVELVRQAAGAAHALHEAGVIHRDIKPGNIMVTRDGSHAVLMDLGLAQLVDDAEGRLTRTRQFVGTLRYASPEQVLAAGALDRRSDVYSLGATLWELLALRPLFGASEATPTPDLMLKIQTEDPESPRRWNPRVPHDLEAIVMKCLEKERARRYATAGDLAEDLARWQAGEAVTAQPPSFRYLLGKYVRRHRGRVAAAAVLVVLALVTNFGAFWRVNEARKEATRLQKATETALFDTYTSHGVSAGDAGNPGQAVLWFANAAFLARDDAHRQEANRIRIRNWSRLVPRPLRAFPHEGRLVEIAFDATGGYLLTRSESRRAMVWDVEEERPLELPALDRPIRRAAWGPKGDLIALATMDGAVELLRFPGGEVRWRMDGAGADVRDLAFSPDGALLASADADSSVRLWRVGLDLLRVVHQSEWATPVARIPHQHGVGPMAFSPDSRLLATAQAEGLVRLFTIPLEGTWHHVLPPTMGFCWFAMSPDGRHVAPRATDIFVGLERVRVHETATGKPAGPGLDAGGIVMDCALFADGLRALTLASTAPSVASRRAESFRPGATPGLIRVWDFRRGELLYEAPRTPAEPWSAAVDRAGKLAAGPVAGRRAQLGCGGLAPAPGPGARRRCAAARPRSPRARRPELALRARDGVLAQRRGLCRHGAREAQGHRGGCPGPAAGSLRESLRGLREGLSTEDHVRRRLGRPPDRQRASPRDPDPRRTRRRAPRLGERRHRHPE
jgi:hypothetical protein